MSLSKWLPCDFEQCHPLLWGGGILVDHWSTISSFEAEKKSAGAVYLPRQSVQSWVVFDALFGQETSLFRVSCQAISTSQVWQDGGIAWSPNWNSRGARIFVNAVTIIIVASSVWMMGWLCVLETLHVTLAKSGSRRIGKRMTGPWSSSSNARQLLPRRGLMILWWTILSRSQLLMTAFKPHPSRRSLTGRPGRRMAQRERTSQPPHPSIPMIYTSKTVSSSVLVVVRPSRSDGPSGARGSDHHRRHSGDRNRHQDHHRGLSRRHGSPRAESARWHSPRPHESSERARPSSTSGRSSSKSRHSADSTAHPGSARVSSGATVDQRSLPSQHHSRQHDGDSTDHPGSPHVSKKEIALKTTSSSTCPVSEQMKQRTITVIQSPVQPESVADAARSADLAKVAKSARSADSAIADNSAKVADPARSADTARAAYSAKVVDQTGNADSARVADPAGDAIPAAVPNPAGSDTPAHQSMDQGPGSDDSSLLIFPSLPRQINQAGLLDFMSMMTLMQRHFGEGTPAVTPETTAEPATNSSTILGIRRLPSCSPSPDTRDNDTTGSPVRSSRSPVRRYLDFEDSPRSATRSRLPLRTSSFS